MAKTKNKLEAPASVAEGVQTHWISPLKTGLVLRLWVQPKASKTRAVGLHGDPPRLKIQIAAPPVDGKANAEIIHFFSTELKLSQSHFEILRGETGRAKDLFIHCDASRNLSLFTSQLLALWT